MMQGSTVLQLKVARETVASHLSQETTRHFDVALHSAVVSSIESMTDLRSAGDVRRLLGGVVRIERIAPLLAVTPPFQSGFVARRSLPALRALERRAVRVSALAQLADQVVCVARAASSSANSAR